MFAAFVMEDARQEKKLIDMNRLARIFERNGCEQWYVSDAFGKDCKNAWPASR